MVMTRDELIGPIRHYDFSGFQCLSADTDSALNGMSRRTTNDLPAKVRLMVNFFLGQLEN